MKTIKLPGLFLSIAWCFVAFSLAACGGGSNKTNSDNGGQVAAVNPLPDRIALNMDTNWLYSKQNLLNGEMANLDDSGFEQVSVPHANTILDRHLNIDVNDYRFISWYRRHFVLDAQYTGARVFIEFEGVATVADVYVNGQFVKQHKGAYTSFTYDITDFIKTNGQDNVLAVKVDSTRRPDVPPEGGSVDYALFGGIVRDVNMIITNPVYLADTFITTPDVNIQQAKVNTSSQITNTTSTTQSINLETQVRNADGEIIATGSAAVSVPARTTVPVTYNTDLIANPHLWDIDDPYLYSTQVSLKVNGKLVDSKTLATGFRFFEFTQEGFYLNGRKLKLIGLNRHEQWPWIGRAIPNRLQARDADNLKYELGNNIVRLSHYPQDPAFIKRADEIGLMLIEELPGWQHIGDLAWQELAKFNLKEMILRDRNHPSIISWGVRINESWDSHNFYTATNAIAQELDPTRPTHGVRTNENPDGEYLENGFYGYNDYNCWDGSTYIKSPRDVPWLITETNCFWRTVLPNSSDSEWVTHMKEFARIHEAVNINPNILGSIGWSYVDYNTEVDYNNTNKVFYSGVYDLFRMPRFSAAFYGSQKDPAIYGAMVKIASFWTQNSPTNVTIASNAEEVELFINDQSLGREPPVIYPGLNYPLFEFSVPFQAGILKAVAYINGQQVASDTVNTPGIAVALELAPDFTSVQADGSDLTSVTVRAVDANGNWVPYAANSVSFEVTGAGRFIGENPINLENGRASLFVQSKFKQTGAINIKAMASGLSDAQSQIEAVAFTQATVPVPAN